MRNKDDGAIKKGGEDLIKERMVVEEIRR